MINPEFIRVVKLSPGEASALALFASLYSKHSGAIKKLIENHEEKFTGDPNLDLQQIANLMRNKGEFFTRDFVKVASDAKYFSLGDLVDKVKDVASNALPALGQGLQVLAPIAGVAANAAAPGTGGLATGLTSALGAQLGNMGKPNTSASPQLQPQVQQAVNAVFANSQTGNLDTRPPANDLLNLLTQMSTDVTKTDSEETILGMKKWVFWTVTGGVLLVIAIIITIVVIRARRKKKALEAKK